MRLYIIRHADPDYTRDSLTEAGHREARALAERLEREGLDKLYSSPLGRARATASYTSEALGKEVEILPWIEEISDGMVEVDGYGPMAAWDAPGELFFDGEAPAFEPDGWFETPYTKRVGLRRHYAEIAEASDRFLFEWGYRRSGQLYEVEQANERKLAIFCHGGSGLCLLSHLLRIPPLYLWTGFWLPPSSVTTVLFEMRSSRKAVPRCLAFADMSHLYAARLPLSYSGLLANRL